MPTAHARPLVRDDSLLAHPIAVAQRSAQDCGPQRAMRPVTHGHAALAFFTAGQSRLEQNGRWELGAGDVVLVPAGQAHRVSQRQDAQYWGLSLYAPSLAAVGAANLLAPFERVRAGAAAVVNIPQARRAFLSSLFDELAQLGSAAAGRGDVEQSLLTLILSEVERAAPPLPRAALGTGGVVAESLRFIEHNCLGPLGLRDVAAAVGRSPAYVTSALTRATGRSAVAWIVSGRMAEARRLLLRSDETVEAIAERVGYADATHFIRTFRKSSGLTPTAFRKRLSPKLQPVNVPVPD